MSKLIKSNLTIIIGNLIYALGIVFFILPSGLITGGTTGIGLAVKHTFGMDISVVIAIFNGIMFVLGYIFLGKKFALGTLVSTIFYPFFLHVLQEIVGDYILTTDLLICTIFGGLCIGGSIAIIVRADGSTGGIDIPLLILQKYTGIPLSKSLYIVDSLILLLQAYYSPKLCILYGILLVIIYTLAIEKLQSSGDSKIELEIISKDSDKIKNAILNELDRGVTIYYGETGKLGNKTDIVVTVISPRELFQAEKLITSIDPSAFIIRHRVSHVSGRGFSKDKVYL